jgi:hypothetical protein
MAAPNFSKRAEKPINTLTLDPYPQDSAQAAAMKEEQASEPVAAATDKPDDDDDETMPASAAAPKVSEDELEHARRLADPRAGRRKRSAAKEPVQSGQKDRGGTQTRSIMMYLSEDMMREFKEVVERLHKDDLNLPKYSDYARRAVAEFIERNRPKR